MENCCTWLVIYLNYIIDVTSSLQANLVFVPRVLKNVELGQVQAMFAFDMYGVLNSSEE